jgi:ABC-2 type transport system ATP-binding protein
VTGPLGWAFLSRSHDQFSAEGAKTRKLRARWHGLCCASSPGAGATVRPVSDPETAVASEAGAEPSVAPANEGAAQVAIGADRVWKTFRLPFDRPSTLKQRVLHPRKSRAATQLHALRDVSFEIERGEFFGIIGRNGSGKSTMLKCLAGIYQPDRGTISVSDRVSPFIELGVGFNPELTARDNVIVNAALLGMPRAETLERFPEIIRFAELEQFVDLKLKNYSSGMQVRLGFSAAIQTEADTYLVDEVLAVGDARFQEKCFDVFRQMKRDGRTVVYVTHDLSSVERFCDRALLLERGEVAAIGHPRTVIQNYRQLDLEREQGTTDGTRELSRWGDRAAEVLETWFEDEAGVSQTVISQGERVALNVRIAFRHGMENPVFGVIVRNEHDDDVFVTNTLFDGIETGVYSAGDEVVYRISFEVSFADGRYMVSPAIAYQDAQRFADWRENLLSVRIRADRYTSGIVDVPHEVAIERAG